MELRDAYTIERRRGEIREYHTGDSWVENPGDAYRFLTETGAQRVIDTALPKVGGVTYSILTMDNAQNIYYGWV